MTKPPKEEDRLRHMLEASVSAVNFVRGKKRSNLDTDTKLALALVRLLEVLGEAARHVSDDTRERYPKIPWKDIASTRDRLVHGYFDVDLDIVWQIVAVDLPPLVNQLERIVSAFKDRQ